MFTPRARIEAIEAVDFIADEAQSPLNAVRWYEGLEKAIDGLSTFPKRCAVAPETEYLGEELRPHSYKSYRIIFRVEEQERIVRVLHVRHGAMLPLGQEQEDEDDGEEPAEDP